MGRHIYLVVENAHCNPIEAYIVVEVFTSKKKAFAFLNHHPCRWVQIWTPCVKG